MIGKNTITIFCTHIPVLKIVEILMYGLNVYIVTLIQVISALIVGVVMNIIIRQFFPSLIGEHRK